MNIVSTENPFTATSFQFNNSVISSSATTLNDHYADPIGLSEELSTVYGVILPNNDFANGKKHHFKEENTYVFKGRRTYTGNATDNTSHIQTDGRLTSFTPYDFTTGATNNLWESYTSDRIYDAYGYNVQETDIVGVTSASLIGYDHSLVSATASNCRYKELAFDSFEDYDANLNLLPETKHGHFNWIPTGGAELSIADDRHTGIHALKLTFPLPISPKVVRYTIDYTQPPNAYVRPEPNKKYVFSYWSKDLFGVLPKLQIKEKLSTNGGTTLLPYIAPNVINWNNGYKYEKRVIDGWTWHQYTFAFSTNVEQLKFEIFSEKLGEVLIDDVRLTPYRSISSAFSYDQYNQRLMATLDQNNFATFYNYDEEGGLVQVKRETEKGIQTISTQRSNTAN